MYAMIKVSDYQSRFKSQYSEEQQSEVLEFYEVNRFFVWWMKTSGNTIKHKVNLLNSSSYEKDMKEVIKDLEDTIAEFKSICTDKNTPDEVIEIFKQYGTLALENYGITDNSDYKQLSDTPTSRSYMEKIINEIMTFADNEFYPTPEESVENRLNFKLTVYESLQKIL
jgi:predicted nucleic acid-binding protein